MKTTWTVIADSARARIFESRGVNSELKEIETLTHPESRLHEGDLRTGGKGEVFDSSGQGEHQSDPQVSTSEKHTARFAKQISTHLSKAEHEGQFETLVLVAEPSLLGALREKLDTSTAKRIEREIDKNWSRESPRRIQELLDASS